MSEQLAQSWWLILLSVMSGVLGQLCLKMGLSNPPAGSQSDGLMGLAMAIIGSPLVILGLFLYALGALAWISVLRRMDLSYAYPFLALNFVLITLVARFVLGEAVPPMRWLGIGVICVGILVVARSV